MAIVVGRVDSLESIIRLLQANGVNSIHSIEDLFRYSQLCSEEVRKVRVMAEEGFDKRSAELMKSIKDLEALNKLNGAGVSSFLKKLFFYVSYLLLQLRHKYFLRRREKYIQRIVIKDAKEFYRSKRILEDHSSLIQGAIGEDKVLRELSKLSDSFYIINNFKRSFLKPIYNKKTKEKIMSIQADHIVVGPTGVFLIETKNWSKKTILNSEKFGPIEQVKRAGYGIFCILNPKQSLIGRIVFKRKKLSVRNIVVMTSQVTMLKDPFVRVTGLDGVLPYLRYFPDILNEVEVKEIVQKLGFRDF